MSKEKYNLFEKMFSSRYPFKYPFWPTQGEQLTHWPTYPGRILAPIEPFLTEMLQVIDASMIVIGETGSGKTTQALFHQELDRVSPDRPFPVDLRFVGEEKHFVNHLLQRTALNLFVRAVEKFDNVRPERNIRPDSISPILNMTGSGNFARKAVNFLLKKPPAKISKTYGSAPAWFELGMPIARRVDVDEAKQKWLMELRTSMDKTQVIKILDRHTPKTLWKELMDLAQQGGVEKMDVLIDGLPRNNGNARQAVDDILELTQHSGLIQTNMILFVEPPTVKHISDHGWPQIGLSWTDVDLERLLRERLRVAGTRKSNLAEFSSSETIDQEVIEAAQGSPRKFMEICDALFQDHAAISRRPAEDLISPETLIDVLERFGVQS